MTHAASSSHDEVALFQPARETRVVQRVAAAVLWYRHAVSRVLNARDRYLEAAVDHVELEKRRRAWDTHEQAALRRLSAGLY